MKPKKLIIVLFAAAPMFAANFVSAQTVSVSPVAPMTPPGRPPFGKPNLGDMLARLLLLTDAQRGQLRPYIDAVQPQLDATHQQARQAEDALLKQLHASIRPLLTPEQQIKLDALEAMRVTGPPPPAPAGIFEKAL
jgi:Spy/CpxP family protein refolding chaperone